MQASTSRHKNCRQFRRNSHSQGLNVPPGDVELNSTLSSISHVTLENLTHFLSSLLNFNAATENHQELSPPRQHDKALHQAADGWDSLQMWGVAANIINKRWQTSRKG
jgi:hypothetical protein